MTIITWRPPPLEIQSLIGIRRQWGGGWWALSGMNVGEVSVSYCTKYQRKGERALRMFCILVSTYESNICLREISHRAKITECKISIKAFTESQLTDHQVIDTGVELYKRFT